MANVIDLRQESPEALIVAAQEMREFLHSMAYDALRRKWNADVNRTLGEFKSFRDTSQSASVMCAAERMRTLSDVDRWMREIISEGKQADHEQA